MSGRGSARRAAQLQCAAALGAILASPALAQAVQPVPPQSGPTELDPSAPLDPMPDLGVEWPDLNGKDTTAAPAPAAAAVNAPTEAASAVRGSTTAS